MFKKSKPDINKSEMGKNAMDTKYKLNKKKIN